ncbi:hypothetical protein WC5_02965 [Escherichia sp. KTE114]|nr:hypothetical protein WC5_02965 [Escherichia sp. KTE114]
MLINKNEVLVFGFGLFRQFSLYQKLFYCNHIRIHTPHRRVISPKLNLTSFSSFKD